MKNRFKKKTSILRKTLLILVVGFLITKYVLLSLYDNTRLGWYGKPTKAVIIQKEYKGARRRGPGKFYFNFEIDKRVYEGAVEKNGALAVGDSIQIFYLESDPTVNCSYEYAKGIFFQTIIEK
tara:strand:+ start:236 stop:604 length:369 start_codon:yes stop_codon:yes gene_type:complete